MRMRRIGLFLVLAAAAVGVTGRVAATPAGTPRTVYVWATDSKGAAVTDLTAADLAVKEGGKEAAITSLKPATEPLQVAVLVEDGGTGVFQAGVLQFLQAFLNNDAQFSIRQFSPQAVKILDYSNDVAPIQDALNKLGRRGKVDADGENLIEAISEAGKELQKRKAARPVILMFTVSGEGQQPKNPDIVMTELASTGAMLNVVCSNKAQLGLVTGDGPKQSGGRNEAVGGASGVPDAITKITDALNHQYVLTYSLADGVKPSDRLSVSTTRKGISLHAPSRIPDK